MSDIRVHITSAPNSTTGGKPLNLVDVNPANYPQGNPNPTHAPQFTTGYAFPIAVEDFGSGQGSYAVQLTVGLDLTSALPWAQELAVYAIPHAQAFPLGSTLGFQGRYAPNATGIYTFVCDSLQSDTSYDIYVTYEDQKRNETPGLLVATTNAHPVIISVNSAGFTQMPANIQPGVTVLTGPIVIGQETGATSLDLEWTLTLDDNGYYTHANATENQWIARIDLMQRVHGAGDSAWSVVNDIPINTTNGSTYTATVAGVGLQTAYDFGVRYRDFAGHTSLIGGFSPAIGTVAGTLSLAAISQLPNNPDVTQRLTLLSSTPASALTYTGLGTAGAYDVLGINFSIAETQTTKPWFELLEYYAVANDSGSLNNVGDLNKLIIKGTRSVSSDGVYHISVDGLSSNTPYALYIAAKDAQGNVSAPRFLNIITPAKPQIVTVANFLSMPASGYTPIVTPVGNPSLLGTATDRSGATTYDVQFQFTLDYEGYSTNPWLAQIDLLQSIQGQNAWSVINDIAILPSGTYTVAAPNVGLNTGYDYAVRYRDYAGAQTAPIKFVSNFVAGVLKITDIGNLPKNPTPQTPLTLLSSPPASSIQYVGIANAGTVNATGTAGAYDVLGITFQIQQTQANSPWFELLEYYAIANDGGGLNLQTDIPKLTLKGTRSPNPTGRYTIAVDGLSAGTPYAIYIAAKDASGITCAPTYVNYTTPAVPQVISVGNLPKMPANTIPTATVVTGPIIIGKDTNAGATAYDLKWTLNLDANGYNTNPWLAQIDLVQSVSGQNLWTVVNDITPISSGTYTITAGGVSVGTSYDYAIRYHDFSDGAPTAITNSGGHAIFASNVNTGTLAIGNLGQLPANPDLTKQLTLATSASIPQYIGVDTVTGTAHTGSYDALNIQFSVKQTPSNGMNDANHFPQPWFELLEYYTVPNPNPADATHSATSYHLVSDLAYMAHKGTRSPSLDGTYTIGVDGLVAGTSYSIYIAAKDAQGNTCAPLYLGITTPAIIQTINQTNLAGGALGVTPNVATNNIPGLLFLQQGPYSTTVDAEAGFSVDTVGSSANLWLREISLVASIAGQNKFAEVGKVGITNLLNYVGVWSGLGTGNHYDLGVQYIDIAGNLSNVGLLNALQNVSIPLSTILPSQLPTNPNPNVAPAFAGGYSYPLALAPFAANSGVYDARVNFALTIAAPVWLAEIRTYAIPSGSAFVANNGLKSPLAPNGSGSYTATFDALIANQAYDLYITYMDHSHNETPPLKIATAPANPLILGHSGQPSIPANTVASVTLQPGLQPTVIGTSNVAGATSYDLKFTFTLDDNGYQLHSNGSVNEWLSQLDLLQSVTGQNSWSVVNDIAIQQTNGSVYTAIAPGVGLAIGYDYAIRYRDQKGNTSVNVAAFKTNVVAGTLSIGNINQLPLNPNLSNRLTLLGTGPASSIVYVGMGTAGAYDATNITFSIAENQTTSPWLELVNYYAIANDSGNLFTVADLQKLTFKGSRAVQSSGIYTIGLDGLSSGTPYAIYIAGKDAQGNVCAPRYINVTTPAVVQTIGAANFHTMPIPAPTTVATPSNQTPTVIGTQPSGGTTSRDLQFQFTLDTYGYTTNLWLNQINLLQSITGLNKWAVINDVPLQPNGTYTVVATGVALGTAYDYAVQYVDIVGNMSNPGLIASNVTAGTLSITNIASLPANPNTAIPPTITTYPVVNTIQYVGLGTAGAYDANGINFQISQTQANSPWVELLEFYAIPNDSGNLSTVADLKKLTVKGTRSPSTDGNYSINVDGLSSGTPYAIYIALKDATGHVSAPAYLHVTTPAKPQIITVSNFQTMPSAGYQPSITSSTAIGALYIAGSTTFDAEYSINLDAGGYLANGWLAEIELVAAQGSNPYALVGTLSPNAISGSSYIGLWGGLGAGNTYNLGVRYVDFAGTRSAVSNVISNVSIGILNVLKSSLPGNPNPNLAVSSRLSPVGSSVLRGGVSGTYDAPVTFALTATTANAPWLAAIRTFAGKNNPNNAGDGGAANIASHSVLGGDKGLTLIGEYVTTSDGNYQVIYELASGTSWDLYVSYLDFQGVVSAPTYTGLTTPAVPQIIGNVNQAGGAVGVSPNAAAKATPAPVATPQPSQTTLDIIMPFYTDDVGTTDNTWLAEIQLVQSVTTLNNWNQCGSLAPVSPDGSLYGQYNGGIWVGLGTNQTYDLGIRYVDYAGNFSQVLRLFTYAVPNLQVAQNSLPGMPNGTTITATQVGTYSYSGAGNPQFNVTFQFNLGLPGSYPNWFAGYNILGKDLATYDGDTDPSHYYLVTSVDLNPNTTPIPTPITATVSLGATELSTQFGIQVYDHAGNATHAYPLPTITTPQKASPAKAPAMPNGTTVSATLNTPLTYSGVGSGTFSTQLSINAAISGSNPTNPNWLAGYNILAKQLATGQTSDSDTTPGNYQVVFSKTTTALQNPIIATIPLGSGNFVYELALQVFDSVGNASPAAPFTPTTPQILQPPSQINFVSDSDFQVQSGATSGAGGNGGATTSASYWSFAQHSGVSGYNYGNFGIFTGNSNGANQNHVAAQGSKAHDGAFYSEPINVFPGQQLCVTCTTAISVTQGRAFWGLVDVSDKNNSAWNPATQYISTEFTAESIGIGHTYSLVYTVPATGGPSQVVFAGWFLNVIGNVIWVQPQVENGTQYSGHKPGAQISVNGQSDPGSLGTPASNPNFTNAPHGALSVAVLSVIDNTGTANAARLGDPAVNSAYQSAPHGAMSVATKQIVTGNSTTGQLNLTGAATNGIIGTLPHTASSPQLQQVVGNNNGNGYLNVSPPGGVQGQLPQNAHDPVIGAGGIRGYNAIGTNNQVNYLNSSQTFINTNRTAYSVAGAMPYSTYNSTYGWGVVIASAISVTRADGAQSIVAPQTFYVNNSNTFIYVNMGNGTLVGDLYSSGSTTYSDNPNYECIGFIDGNTGAFAPNGYSNSNAQAAMQSVITDQGGGVGKYRPDLALSNYYLPYTATDPKFQNYVDPSTGGFRFDRMSTYVGTLPYTATNPNVTNLIGSNGSFNFNNLGTNFVGTLNYGAHSTAFQNYIDNTGAFRFDRMTNYTGALPYNANTGGIQNVIDTSGVIRLDRASTQGQLSLASHDFTIQNRNGISYGVLGAPPYVDNNNVLQIPSNIRVTRSDGSANVIVAPTSVALNSTSGQVFVTWTPTPAGGFNNAGALLSLARNATGVAGVGYQTTLTSINYEPIGVTYPVSTPYEFDFYGGNSSIDNAAYSVLVPNPTNGTATYRTDMAHPSYPLPYINTDVSIKNSAGLQISVQGQPPYLNGTTVYFPSAVYFYRPDNTFSYIAANSTVVCSLNSGYGTVYMGWVSSGQASLVFVSQGATAAYEQSSAYERVGVGTLGNFSFEGNNSSTLSAAYNIIDNGGTRTAGNPAGGRLRYDQASHFGNVPHTNMSTRLRTIMDDTYLFRFDQLGTSYAGTLDYGAHSVAFRTVVDNNGFFNAQRWGSQYGTMPYNAHDFAFKSVVNSTAYSDGNYFNSGLINARHINVGQVNSGHIGNGQIQNQHISSRAIQGSNIAQGVIGSDLLSGFPTTPIALGDGSGKFKYSIQPQTIQNRGAGIHVSTSGSTPFIANNNSLQFPSTIIIFRPNGDFTRIGSGAACNASAWDAIYVPWVSGGYTNPININYSSPNYHLIFDQTDGGNYEILGYVNAGTDGGGYGFLQFNAPWINSGHFNAMQYVVQARNGASAQFRHDLAGHYGNIPHTSMSQYVRGVVDDSGHVSSTRAFRAQGSLLNIGGIPGFSYNTSPSTITITVAATTITYTDGSTANVSALTFSFNVSPSSTYFMNFAINVSNPDVPYYIVNKSNNGNLYGAATSSTTKLLDLYSDNTVPIIGDYSLTTPAAGQPGGGGSQEPPPSGCPANHQEIETLEYGFISAEKLQPGMSLRDPIAGWNKVYSVMQRPTQIHRLITNTDIVDVSHDHYVVDGNGEWTSILELNHGDEIKGFKGTNSYVSTVMNMGRGTYISINCENHRYVLGKQIGHNSTAQCPARYQMIETKEVGFIRADELDIGMHLPDGKGGWNLIHDVEILPTILWRFTVADELTEESFDVNDSHACKDLDGKWIMVSEMVPGQKLYGHNGPLTVVEAYSLGKGEYVGIDCENHTYQMGQTLSHNVNTLL